MKLDNLNITQDSVDNFSNTIHTDALADSIKMSTQPTKRNAPSKTAYVITIEQPHTQNPFDVLIDSYSNQPHALIRCKSECEVVRHFHPNSQIEPVECHYEDSNGHPVSEVIGFSVSDADRTYFIATVHHTVQVHD